MQVHTIDPNFKVALTQIINISPHPNPVVERLEIATVYGFQVIVGKGTYKVGQKVIYLPVNSILPRKLETFLFPPDSKITLDKSRIKACKIQQFVSQGMIAPWEEIKNLYKLEEFPLETDLQLQLNVVKYYPPIMGRTINTVSATTFPKIRNKPKNNIYFKEYNGCTNINWVPNAFTEEDIVWVSEKIHGCLQADTLISTWDGQKLTIKNIVDNKLDIYLIGYDEYNKPVPTKIKNWFNNGVSKNWLKIKFDRKNLCGGNTKYYNICVTPNHKFYMFNKHEYIEAKNLKIGDTVSFAKKKKKLSSIQKSILLGKLLGDGSITNSSMYFGHKKEHESYVDFTLNSLGEIAGNKQKDIISGYGSIIARGRTKSLEDITRQFSSFYDENNRKIIPSDIKLDPISLAFWYMDDGSLSHTEFQKDRALFATCGFKENDIDNLIIALAALDLKGTKYLSDNDKYWRIRLDTNSSQKLFEIIRPYVPFIMQYKLPLNMRGSIIDKLIPEEKEEWEVEQREILDISEFYSDKINMSKYDLETETHNFVANNIIVHNSNWRAGYLPNSGYKIYYPNFKLLLHKKTIKNFFASIKQSYISILDKIKEFFKLSKEFEFCYGSNTVQRQKKTESPTWYGEDIYAQICKNYLIKEKLKDYPGYVLYGEIYGPNVQKGYHYGLKNGERKLIIFDIMYQTKTSQTWLSCEDAYEFCKKLELPFVPILYKGKWDKTLAINLAKGNSILCPIQKVIEGVVVKNDNVLTLDRRKIKIINPEYTMKESKGETTDFTEIEGEVFIDDFTVNRPKPAIDP